MNLTLSTLDRQRLIEKYPYLQVRNVWTDEICDNDSIRGEHELPEGWMRLFLLYCKDLKKVLPKSYLDKFRFSQIKEKYGSMRLYDFGSTKKGHNLETVYCYMSWHICERCGNWAKYQTVDWIDEYCKECFDSMTAKHPYFKSRYQDIGKIKPILVQTGYKSVKIFGHRFGFKTFYFYRTARIKRLYNKVLKMSDAEFVEYLLK